MDRWIKVDTDLGNHPRIAKLARHMGGDRFRAIGLLVSLWGLAGRHHEAGEIDLQPEELAINLGAPEQAVTALLASGWLEAMTEGYRIPNWEARQSIGAIKAKRDRDRLRMSQRRSGYVSATSEQRSGGDKTREERDNKEDHGGPRQTASLSPSAPLDPLRDELARLILSEWPPDRRCSPREVMLAVAPAAFDKSLALSIVASARVWVANSDPTYLPNMYRWLSSGAYREAPPALRPKPASPRQSKAGRIDGLALGDMIMQAEALEARTNTKETP